jgi:hypothetical protein
VNHKAGTLNMVWTAGKEKSGARNRVLLRGLISIVIVLVAGISFALISAVRPDAPSGVAAGVEASSARWAALGRHFTAETRARAADSARWAAQGAYFSMAQARARAADSARWAAQGDSYWNSIEAGVEASSARYQALGEWYAGKTAEGR